MIEIDGSQGEGGGQVLRTSLALSILTGKPFRITKIRAGREKPGLLRQHLTGVNAAAAIAGAEVEGAELGSREVAFVPGEVKPDTYTFAIGTAGSVNLVLQTVLMPLALATGKARLKLDGGTHNPASPPFVFLEKTFAPLLAKMGPKLDLELVRWGFYPAGGGRVVADLAPAPLVPLHLPERGAILAVRIRAAVAGGLPEQIAKREIVTACLALGRDRGDGRVVVAESPGPGNVMWIEVECEHLTAVFTGFGEKSVRAEVVAERCAAEAKRWMDAEVPVDEHLADQLLLPMALAGEGSFRTTEPSLHTTTNIEVIRRFLEVPISIGEVAGAWEVRVG